MRALGSARGLVFVATTAALLACGDSAGPFASQAEAGGATHEGSNDAGARLADATVLPDGDDAPDSSAPDSGAPVDAGAPDANGEGDTGVVAPTKIVAGYYPNWTASPVRIRD